MKNDFLANLKHLAKKKPEENLRLIIRLNQPVEEAVSVLEERGIRIRRKHHLIRALSVEVTARQAAELEKEDWVTSLEEDKEVRATKGD